MKKRIVALFLCLITVCLCFGGLVSCRPKTFTVTFKPGAEGVYQDPRYEVPEVQTVSSWKELKEPIYIRDGYTFSDWDTVLRKINSDTVVSAVWKPYPFIIKFDPVNPNAVWTGGGIKEQTVYNWAEVVFPKFELEGYTIDWPITREDALITEDTTVYANWIPNKYSLSFVDENGEKYDYQKVEVVYDALVGGLPTPEKEDKVFGGWRFENDISKYIMEGGVWKYPNDAVLQATWLDEGQYRIVYKNAYDVKGPIAYTANDDTFVIGKPERYGYDFLGWTGTGITGEPVQNVTVEHGSTGHREYTANWKVKTRTINLDADGGLLNVVVKNVTYGEKLGTLPTNVVKDGYEFVGWMTPNGVMVDQDTVWSWDPDDDKVNVLKAVYKRLYTIKLVFECEVSGDIVTAHINEATSKSYELEKSQTEENVWVFTRKFREGDRIGNLPTRSEIKITQAQEYAFNCWSSGGVTVHPSDIVGETKFPNSLESGEIYITIKCTAMWTPFF